MIFFRGDLSIKKEVFYMGLAFSIITLLVFGLLFSNYLSSVSVERAKNSIMERNRQISIFTEAVFTEITNTIEALSQNEDSINAHGGEPYTGRALVLYRDFFAANKNITYIYSGYEDGSLLINDYITPPGFDSTVRPWYLAAMESCPEQSVGFPYQDASTGEWVIFQSKTLLDEQGNRTGVIAIDLSLGEVAALMDEDHLYASQHSFIMQQNGEIIIHANEDLLGKTVPAIVEGITGREGELVYVEDDRTLWAYYNTIDTTGWLIVTAVDRREVLLPIIGRIALYTLAVVILATALGILQSKIIGKRFAEPLMALGQRVAAITEGKSSVEGASYQHSNQEIATIAGNIEQLAEHSLQKKANELKTIIESTQDGILVVDDKRQMIYVNSRFKEMWQIMGDTDVLPADRELLDSIVDQLAEPQSVLEKIEELYTSCNNDLDTLTFKDGRVYERFTRPLISEGQLLGRLWSFRDITERKRAEQKFADYTLELEQLYHQLDGEIDKARQVHERILPKSFPAVEGLCFAAHYQPAQNLGGDFYDVLQADNKLIFYLSDVSGHGLNGAMLSVFVKHTIKSYISNTPLGKITPAAILYHLAGQFGRENYPEDLYVCVFMAVLDPDSMELSYCGAGFQEALLVQLGNGERLKLQSKGMFISSYLPVEILELQENRITLTPGSTIFCNTDGLTEHESNGAHYMDRLPDVFFQNAHLPAHLVAQAVMDDFRRFNNDSLQGKDDITFLVLQVDPDQES